LRCGARGGAAAGPCRGHHVRCALPSSDAARARGTEQTWEPFFITLHPPEAPWEVEPSQGTLTPPSDGCPSTCRGFDRKKMARDTHDTPRQTATAMRRVATRPRRRRDRSRRRRDRPRPARDGGATDRDGGVTGGDPPSTSRNTPRHLATRRPAATAARQTATAARQTATAARLTRDGGATDRDPPATSWRHLGDIPRHHGDTRDTLTTGTWTPIGGGALGRLDSKPRRQGRRCWGSHACPRASPSSRVLH